MQVSPLFIGLISLALVPCSAFLSSVQRQSTVTRLEAPRSPLHEARTLGDLPGLTATGSLSAHRSNSF